MRGHLAIDLLHDRVADFLAEKRSAKSGHDYLASLEQFVRNSATIFRNTGSGYGQTYRSVGDPRFAQLGSALQWRVENFRFCACTKFGCTKKCLFRFEDWHDAVFAQDLTDSLTKTGRARQFLSWETWYDCRLTVKGFTELCAHYLPTAPEGCGIRACRLSQDPCEVRHHLSVFAAHPSNTN